MPSRIEHKKERNEEKALNSGEREIFYNMPFNNSLTKEGGGGDVPHDAVSLADDENQHPRHRHLDHHEEHGES